MHPDPLDPLGQARGNSTSHPPRRPRDSPTVTRSLSGVRRLQSDESWIEVPSRPSSSSLSSAATDEVVTTGLRVQADPNARRRRRLHRPSTQIHGALRIRSMSAAGSSQEEYEESESESDRILGSSNEELQQGFRQEDESPPAPSSASEDAPSASDDDGNSTALGITNATEPLFTPQPNAFSHPPVSRQGHAASVPGSYFPSTQRTASMQSPSSQRSQPIHRTRSHTPYTMLSPSYTTDHDAALRASLSTLLSCAAAARGLPKREQSTSQRAQAGPNTHIEPSAIRMIPESALPSTTVQNPPPLRRNESETSSVSPASPLIQGKGKRKSSSRDRRDVRKKRRGGIEDLAISPTLMTWVVSAGVVVLFSAISFSAGYAYGKEVGRIEGVTMGSESCTREAAKMAGSGSGLRRLRWGNASVVRV